MSALYHSADVACRSASMSITSLFHSAVPTVGGVATSYTPNPSGSLNWAAHDHLGSYHGAIHRGDAVGSAESPRIAVVHAQKGDLYATGDDNGAASPTCFV